MDAIGNIVKTRKTKRNSTVELLRIVFMLLIVMLHVYGHGMGDNMSAIYAWGCHSDMYIHLALFVLGKLGVTGFMFISGYYGMRFNLHRFAEMLFMLLFYAILTNDGTGREQLLHPWDIWWFLSCYLFIFVMSPIISKGLESIDKKQFTLITACLLIYIYVGHFLSARNEHSLDLLLTIYIAGRYVKTHLTDKIRKVPGKILGVTILLILLVYILIPLFLAHTANYERWMSMWISNNNIFPLVISALLVVFAETKQTYNKIINYLSSSVLAVYLLTDNKKAMQLDTWLLPKLIDGIGYIIIIGIFISCLIVDKIREYLFMAINSIYKKLYNK